MSDILELEEGSDRGGGGGTQPSQQTHHPPPPAVGGNASTRPRLQGGGCGGQSDAEENHRGIANSDDQQLQYLHHNCNPRLGKSVNAMSIETDV